MTFVEVLRLGVTGHPVGVFSSTEWVATANEPDRYINLSASQSVITILQQNPSAFLAELHTRLEQLGLSDAPEFPTEAAIRMGLTWNSAHWQEGALRWVQDLNWAVRFRPELLVLERSGRTQHIRHWAKRLARSKI